MIKKLFQVLVAAGLIFSLSGCGTSGGTGSSIVPSTMSSFTADELQAVENTLVADRVLAAQTLEQTTDASLLPSILASGGKYQFRKRNYQISDNTNSTGIVRGTGTCQITMNGENLSIASEACKVDKAPDGTLTITRSNGTTFVVKPATSDGSIQYLEINGITWTANFGEGTDQPLVTLQNTRSGIKLIINESETGELSISRSDEAVFRGRWTSDGSIEGIDGTNRKFRYRNGQGLTELN